MKASQEVTTFQAARPPKGGRGWQIVRYSCLPPFLEQISQFRGRAIANDGVAGELRASEFVQRVFEVLWGHATDGGSNGSFPRESTA